MNPETMKEIGCPATVYGNRECTALATDEDTIGWMIWGRRLTVALRLDGDWVPLCLIHKIPSVRSHALRAIRATR